MTKDKKKEREERALKRLKELQSSLTLINKKDDRAKKAEDRPYSPKSAQDLPAAIQTVIKSIPVPEGSFSQSEIDSKKMKKWKELLKIKSELTKTLIQSPESRKELDDMEFNERVEQQGISSVIGGLETRKESLFKIQEEKEKFVKSKLRTDPSLGWRSDSMPYSELSLNFPDEVKKAEEEWKNKKEQEAKKQKTDQIRKITGMDFAPDFLLEKLPPEFVANAKKQYEEKIKGQLPEGEAMSQLVSQTKNTNKLIETERLENMDILDKAIYKTGKATHKYVDPFAEGVANGLTFFTMDLKLKSDFEQQLDPDNFVQKALRVGGSFVGGLLPYGLLSKGIKMGISTLSSAKAVQSSPLLYKSLKSLDDLAKTNKLWKSVLGEALIFNTLEEATEMILRKGVLKQEYTFNDFMIGIVMGAGMGSVIQLGAYKLSLSEAKEQKQIKKAFEAYEESEDLAQISNMALGNSTFGKVFGETRLAYLKGMDDANIRPGIEKAAPLPEKKTIKGYHVTRVEGGAKSIDEEGFDLSRFGQESGTKEMGDPVGVYFFPSRGDIRGSEEWSEIAKGNIIERDLDIENPYKVSSSEDYFNNIVKPATNTKADDLDEFREISKEGDSDKITNFLKGKGYDAIIDKDGVLSFDEPQIIVLDVGKIRSKAAPSPEVSPELQANQKLPDTTLKTDKTIGIGGEKKLTPEELVNRDQQSMFKQKDFLTPDKGISKQGQDMMNKAGKEKLITSLEDTAEYDKIKLADQVEKATKLINDDLQAARDMIAGKKELPAGLRAQALINQMEIYAKQAKDAELMRELFKSPLLSESSVHAQEMRLMAERAPLSPVAVMMKIRELREKKALIKEVGDIRKAMKKIVKGLEKELKRLEKQEAKDIKKGAKEVGGAFRRAEKDLDRELKASLKRQEAARLKEIKDEIAQIKKDINGAKTIEKAKVAVVRQIKTEIKKVQKVTIKEDWNSFVDQLTC